MGDISKLRKRGVSIFCWAVKGAGLVTFLLILAITIGEGPPNPFELTAREAFMMVGFLAVCVGLGLVLWRQLTGGAVILAGMIEFSVFNGRLPSSWVFHILWLLGLLNIFCGWWKRKSSDV